MAAGVGGRVTLSSSSGVPLLKRRAPRSEVIGERDHRRSDQLPLTTFALEESLQSSPAGCAERCHASETLELRLRTAELWKLLRSVTE